MEMVIFKDLKYSLGSSKRAVTVSGEVIPQSILHVRGQSGSGKTTLLKILARLKSADSGNISFENRDWNTIPHHLWRKCVHYVSQKPVIFTGTFLENLMVPFGLKANRDGKEYDRHKVLELMSRFQLSENLLGSNAKKLSVGEASRMGLLRSLLFNPQVLLVDEPVAALDTFTRRAVLAVLTDWVQQAENRAVILVSHDIDTFTFENTLDLPLGS